MSRPPSGVRPPPREVVELRALADRQPDLAEAAILHAELVALVRRVESRIATPALGVSDDVLSARMARGVPLAAFGEFPIDWTELRLLIRQVTDVLRRVDLIDADSAQRVHLLGRDRSLADRARLWFEGPLNHAQTESTEDPDPMWPEVLLWAMRPFLMRTADVLTKRVPLEAWNRGSCPICGAEPEFAALGLGGERQLVCGRCHARWPFDHSCPFCGNRNTELQRTLATADRVYRLVECLVCHRYVKAIDAQTAGRSVLPFYDPVATLPLDAAMMKGR